MGLWNRLTTIVRAKANKALDAAEDPRETLDCSYERQLDMLRDVKRAIVEVTAARRRLELQAQTHHAELEKLTGQARQALQIGREDLARAALERKQLAEAQLASLEPQIAQLDSEQRRLVEAERRLSAKIEAFRTRKEVVKSQYAAARAQVRIGEAVSGLSEEMADVGYAIQRAEDRIAQLRSRGEPIGELIEQGVLADALETGSTLDRELAQATGNISVEVELARLRNELAAPKAPPQLGAGQ